jgi:diaminopimelate epimerase
MIPFVKMQASGNDFVVFDARHRLAFSAQAFAPALCDRHLGIGADGVILVEPSKRADFKMTYFNADGSRAICGNGMRCVARFLFDRKLLPPDQKHASLEIDGDVVQIDYLSAGERIRIEMGQPNFDASRVPTTGTGDQSKITIEAGGRKLDASAVSMGNPHCVIIVDDVINFPVHSIGAEIEISPYFPLRTNVNFVQIISNSEVNVRIWERGVGETQASGSGSCAVFACLYKNEIVSNAIKINYPGGEFAATVNPANGRILLTGTAAEVFSGDFELDRFKEAKQ